MDSINVTNARQNFYSLINAVNASHRPIHINGKNGNAVLISEDDWKAIEETLYLNSIPGLVEAIKESENESFDEMTDAEDLEW